METAYIKRIDKMKIKIKIYGKNVEYSVKDSKCKKRDCFVPFSGNGQNICRLYEIGRCPENTRI
jgi:hypothetical protein